jgi:hypothetical protein
VPDPLIAVPGHAVAPTVLAVLIATVTALIAGLGLLGLIVDKHLALRNAREAERLRRSEDHLARAQRIAHTGSIEQDLRTGAIESFGETYRIFASGKLSSLSFIPTIAPRLNRKRLLTKPTRGGGFLTCSALPSGFASSSLGAR